MGYTFKIDPEAHLETVTTKLLEAPIEYVDALTKEWAPARSMPKRDGSAELSPGLRQVSV